jgi:small nuclear ribonucleoprotein (snRNP)-like protein
MATAEQIQDALADLEPGSKVKLKLADGSELEGKLASSDADQVQLADADAVEYSQVEDILVQESSDGIE